MPVTPGSSDPGRAGVHYTEYWRRGDDLRCPSALTAGPRPLYHPSREANLMNALVAIVVSASLVIGGVSAASAADEKKLTPQQERMKECNTQAGDKKGDERKAFMSTCLKGGAPATQQDKMKKCNEDANTKALKGDDRKAFMSTCLKGEKKS